MKRHAIFASILLSSSLLSACDGQNDDIGEMVRCEYETTDLSWDDTYQDDQSYASWVEGFSNEYVVRLLEDEAVLTVRAGEANPRFFENASGCFDYTEIPVKVTLTSGEARWTQEIAVESHDGMSADEGLKGSVYLEDVQPLAKFVTLPEIQANETILGAVVELSLSDASGITLDASLSIEGQHGSGKDAGISERRAPWFKVQVPASDLPD